MAQNRKPRILYVAKMLLEETDAEHGLTRPEIEARLEDYGISSERKALYRDFENLREIGFDIQTTNTRPVGYYLGTRLFTPPQMALLLDAVRTSRSITEETSQELLGKLHRLQSTHEAARTEQSVHVTGRAKTQNDSVLTTIAQIQQAMHEKRDISFSYMRYDASLRLIEAPASDGKERVRTPLFLIYADDRYYLLAFDEEAPDNIRSYRVDRMKNVMIRDASDPAHKPDASFDIGRYERERLGMFNMEPVRISLLVAEGLVGNIVDIFGVDGATATPADDAGTWAHMHVSASPSPVFFGQIAQFGGDVRITGPSRVADAYRAHLEACLAGQEGQEG